MDGTGRGSERGSTEKRHQQEHQHQRPTESNDPTQHAKGRTGDCPGPCKETSTPTECHTGGGGGGLLNPSSSIHLGQQARGVGGSAFPFITELSI